MIVLKLHECNKFKKKNECFKNNKPKPIVVVAELEANVAADGIQREKEENTKEIEGL